ncbi:MAG: hypothetical protein AAGG51_02200 [Cyanobacteria bacterium P01_G01_bin.54]
MPYEPQSLDTNIESDRLQFQLLRQKTNAERYAMAAQMIHWSKTVALRGIQKARRERAPEYFAQAVLKEKWTETLTPTSKPTMWIQDPGEIAQRLHAILTDLQIPYYITGGVAAIAYGEPRTTRDLDLVIRLDRTQLGPLVAALEAQGFYCPPGAVADLERGRGRVLSVTHRELLLNADIVLTAESEFDQSKMVRRRLEAIALDETQQLWLVSPEDLILAKLLWGRRSQSEKQWRDVLGVLKVQGEQLDFDYLCHWADRLDILERCDRAIEAAGL